MGSLLVPRKSGGSGGGSPTPQPTVIKLGTLYVNGVKQKRPLYPYGGTPTGAPARGDIPAYTSGNIEIRESDIDEAYHMKWVQVNYLGKTMLIGDRVCLQAISWDTLNSQGLVFGKDITIAGNKYKLRSLTGGSNYRVGTDGYSGGLPVNNEWDQIICNEANLPGLPTPSSADLDTTQNETDRTGVHNSLWNWYIMYSWCQETAAANSSTRAIRGATSANGWYNNAASSSSTTRGWRPVLEPITAPPTPTTKAHVFGVEWNYALSSTTLTRLTPATDPNGLVTEDFSNFGANYIVSPAIGAVKGGSYFDRFMPWAGMNVYNYDGNGRISSWHYGANLAFVSLPKYWYKIEKDTVTSKMRFYVADGPVEGLSVHEAFNRGDGTGERDFIYVARYPTIYSGGVGPVTGAIPQTNITRAQARTQAKRFADWWLWDYVTWCAIWLLYLVEYADWNSQEQIGQGIVNMTAVQNTGGTDSMIYHTGRAAGTNGQTQVQYRGIEGLWGNISQYLDGINLYNRRAYVCLDPTKFAEDTTTNYIDTGVDLLSPSDYIKELGLSESLPFAFLPTVGGGSDSRYIPDYASSDAGWRTLSVGGYYSSTFSAGLFSFISNSPTTSLIMYGSRLMFLP